ncbi:MAG: DUF2867 domain-containing protein [Chloroflexi bacterium]|nr:DUF2867 domain-containing protein [Chloroflexota bacterium]
MNNIILVTGATGYIASRLIPRLLDSGYRVRALARDPLRLRGRGWFRQIEVVPGDAMTPSTLAPALEGVHTAYYLIHNMSSGRGYTEREIEGARNFASAAEQAGVEHVIYLGGLADPEQHIAPHMRSRIETGVVLRRGKVPVTEFRAGVIVGSGSISFEMIRFMTELFPIAPGPAWMSYKKSQPIAIQNVIDYLLAALTVPGGRGGIYEIGGPEVVVYKELMLKYARARGLRRSMLLLPSIPVQFMAFGVSLITPVPYPIAHALIDALTDDSIVKHPEALAIFPEVKLITFDEAARKALGFLSPVHVERVWDDGGHPVKTLKQEGFFIHHREIKVNAGVDKVFRAIMGVMQSNWQVETKQENEKIVVRVKDQFAGDKWLEWRVGQIGNLTYMSQTFFFAPCGLPGFLYWYLLYHFHIMFFRNLIKKIGGECATPVRRKASSL